MAKEIRVIKLEPRAYNGKTKASNIVIPNSLEAMQNEVNGYVQMVYICPYKSGSLVALVNEEGLLMELDHVAELHRAVYEHPVLYTENHGLDLYGNVIICGLDMNDEWDTFNVQLGFSWGKNSVLDISPVMLDAGLYLKITGEVYLP